MDFRKFLLTVLPILIIFKPYPIGFIPEIVVKISLEILLFVIILFLNLKIAGWRNPYFYISLSIYFLSLIFGILFNTVNSSYYDFYDFFYLIYLLLVYRLYSNSSFTTKEILYSTKLIIYWSIIVIVLNFIALNVDVIGKLFNSIYFQKSTSSFEDSRLRISGTFTNPNHFGIFLCTVFYICVRFSRIYFTKKLALISTLIIVIGIYLTGSRTSLIILALIILSQQLRKISLKNLSLLILLAILIPFLIYPILNPRLKESVDLIIQYGPLAIESLSIKYDLSSQSLGIIKENNFFGFGPSNDIPFFIGDNQHIVILWKGGVIGYLAFMIFYYHLTFSKGKNLMIYVLSFLAFITGQFFESQQLISIIIINSLLINELNGKNIISNQYKI